mmetsp:Transcript_5484/g.19985  ORF Transcript_5484/g.19985 Transcript_5484/m.19985 type:complete len:207 (+) Transcript_5484:2271-2891(+)
MYALSINRTGNFSHAPDAHARGESACKHASVVTSSGASRVISSTRTSHSRVTSRAAFDTRSEENDENVVAVVIESINPSRTNARAASRVAAAARHARCTTRALCCLTIAPTRISTDIAHFAHDACFARRHNAYSRRRSAAWCRASLARVGLKDPARNLSRTRAGMGAHGGSSTITTTAFAFAFARHACGDAGDADETAVGDMSLRR